MTWLWRLPVLAALVGAGIGAREVWRVHFDKPGPAEPPAFEPRAPLEVAPLSAFGAPWTAHEFVFAGLPCLALRLPAPISGGLVAPGAPADGDAAQAPAGGDAAQAPLAAFSRVCTHQGCLVDLNLDVEAIAFAFNHRGRGPKLTCACHYSVFDPLRAGRAVSGPARLPLPRVRLRLDDREGTPTVVADGVERSG
jgi:arsenite oxidase small subunit